MTSKKNNYYILTGAMGSGKSTVVNELKDQTLTCIKEPAREILAVQALLWNTLIVFRVMSNE